MKLVIRFWFASECGDQAGSTGKQLNERYLCGRGEDEIYGAEII